jgi:hypothetical protein
MPDRDNWTPAMVLKWVLTRDLPAVLDMAEIYGADFVSEDGMPRAAVPEDIDAVMSTYCTDLTASTREQRVRATVLRSQTAIPGKVEIYLALRRGQLEAQARRNGAGDVETIAPNQWLALKFRSWNGHDLGVPIDANQDILDLPRPIEDYLRGRVSIDTSPVVWPNPLMPAAQVEKLWPAGGAIRFTAGAEAETRRWLILLMSTGDPTQAKPQYEAEAQKKFRVGKRAFIRAWDDALRATGNTRWSKPGPKSKQ